MKELLKIDGIEIYNPTCETGIITLLFRFRFFLRS